MFFQAQSFIHLITLVRILQTWVEKIIVFKSIIKVVEGTVVFYIVVLHTLGVLTNPLYFLLLVPNLNI